MLDILKVTVLSLVEGLTEFIPVSSTGHLILVNEWVNLSPDSLSNIFAIVIQLGAILSVVVLYRYKLNPFTKRKTYKEKQATINIWKKVIVGSIPAVILGFLLDDFIEAKLMNYRVVTAMLFLWGLVIVWIEKRRKHIQVDSIEEMSYKTAFYIGCFQCLAMVPGTSRSASTIIGAMLLGTSRTVAAEFSFFLAIPIMFGASGLKVVKAIVKGTSLTSWHIFLVVLGMVLSFLFALIVVKKFMKYIKKHNFIIFGIYRVLLSLLLGIYFIFIQ